MAEGLTLPDIIESSSRLCQCVSYAANGPKVAIIGKFTLCARLHNFPLIFRFFSDTSLPFHQLA